MVRTVCACNFFHSITVPSLISKLLLLDDDDGEASDNSALQNYVRDYPHAFNSDDDDEDAGDDDDDDDDEEEGDDDEDEEEEDEGDDQELGTSAREWSCQNCLY